MIRVFMDASVFFAALYSSQGAARDLIRLAFEEKVRLIVSQDILDEVARNILKKAPHMATLYDLLLTTMDLEIVDAPPQDIVEQAVEYVTEKDAHVIAAALEAKPDYLVTYDQKHLLGRPEVAERSGLKIVTPDVVVRTIQGMGNPNPPGAPQW